MTLALDRKTVIEVEDTGLRHGLALDRDSVRSIDKDGRMRVARAHISRAAINPYKGSEIPGWRNLGLEPDRIYQLYRDPEELKKATATLNGVPLLRKHTPVNADDHQPDEVVGALGTDAEFDGEYLDNSLIIWAREGIAGVESDAKKELSAGYHYTPDMTAGNFDGKAFDGVMRDIVFNHVALVEDGRAGPDVVVGDSTENLKMKTSRLAALTLGLTAAHVSPLLAMDIALPKSLFKDITTKNFKTKKAEVVASVGTAVKGKLRKGFAFDEAPLVRLLDALEGAAGTNADESVSEEQHKAMEAAAKGESEIGIPKAVGEEFADKDKKKAFDAEAVKGFLREKGMSEDDIEALSGMLPQPATDEFPPKKEGEEDDEEAKKKKAEEAAKKKEAEDSMKDMVKKPAMDAAIASAIATTRATERGIRTALLEVKPWVGELPATLAFDSAADVHRHAAKMVGIAGADKLHADALLPVIQAQPKPGASRNHAPEPRVALDADTRTNLEKMFPGIELIKAA